MSTDDAIIPKSALVDHRAVFAGGGIVLRENTRLDAACVIGEGVTIGQGAWVRAGAVVLNSVPANAIVEGNPAKVVGYRDGKNSATLSVPRLIDAQSYQQLSRPAQVPLGVGHCALYLMRRIVDPRGSLTVGEMPTEIPFAPKRYFAVYDVPTIELRGEHAHRKCQQFLICIHGDCRVLLDDGDNRCEVILDRPDLGVFMPEMIWGTQYRYSRDAVLLVFASRSYENEDYLRNYDEFLSALDNHA